VKNEPAYSYFKQTVVLLNLNCLSTWIKESVWHNKACTCIVSEQWSQANFSVVTDGVR